MARYHGKRRKLRRRAVVLIVILVAVALGAGIFAVVHASRSRGGQDSSSSDVSGQISEEGSSSQGNSSDQSSESSSSGVSSQESSSAASPESGVSSKTSSTPVSQGASDASWMYEGIEWRSPTAEPYSVKYGRNLILINNYYELDESFNWDLVYFSNGETVTLDTLKHWDDNGFNYTPLVDRAAYEPLKKMFAAAKSDGVPLGMVSAYRSIKLQDSLFNQSVQAGLNQGLSKEAAIKQANVSRTFAGTSEHNTGLGFDIAEAGSGYLRQDFENTPQGKWLKAHCAEYGFILRYPKDKVDITGIMYEPWHYRYVGVEHAQKMNELGMCLEEYIDYLGGL